MANLTQIQDDAYVGPDLINVAQPVTHEQFEQLCRKYRKLRLELTSTGELIVMPPTGAETARLNFNLLYQLGAWSRQDGTGICFSEAAGFILPNGAIRAPDAAWVLYFPRTVPAGAITRDEYTAVEHLNVWKLYQENWCEHKPSVTISIRDGEWMGVGAWVYDNFEMVSGIAFLPYAGGNYRQAPYITCTKTQFDELVTKTPKEIDWSEFNEDSDYTEAVRELACMGGVCELG